MDSPGTNAVHTILVADDSISQRQHAITLCTELGVSEILEAEDGNMAMALLKREPSVQVVLADLEMPHMDGVELIQHIATLPHPPALIIASSQQGALIGAVETMVQALGLPLLGAFCKPLSEEQLAEALMRYHPDTHPLIRSHGELTPVSAQELATAITERKLVPYYQPKFQLASGEAHSVEMLARWLRPGRGQVSPAQFIPLAETHALIHDLTLSLIEQALADASRWHADGHALSIAINLSPLLLSQPHFLGDAIDLVDQFQVPPDKIIWEITESALVADIPTALGLLVRMRLKGFGLSIDDYGTGFSSMQQLSRIPFTELKVDRTFVHGASKRPRLQTILQSALDLAHKLNLRTVAEGIEETADLELLRQLGCESAQGYLLAKPMSADAMLTWLAQRDRASPQIRQLAG
jgi:EAL domain-containing protein (putative c-di-GMP-specific phosphodiesterase class I)/DNA-binding NarL/FixJ family response regulator